MKACTYCGKDQDSQAVMCAGCGNTNFEKDSPEVEKLTKAGFKIRALARIIDTLFCMCMGVIAGGFTIIILSIMAQQTEWISPLWQHRLGGYSIEKFLIGGFAPYAYHSICEGLHGATLGKWCCRLRVVRQDGQPNNLKGAFFRSIACLWDFQFLGAVAYTSMQKSPYNQRYGDRWGKTIVLTTAEIPPESRGTTTNFLPVLALGIVANIVFVIIGLVLHFTD